MDGDRQNDPADIPRLIERLNQGFDVVSGWRKNRQDKFLNRRLPSKLANKWIAWLSGVGIHDFGCTMKAYRRDVLDGVRLYGEMHRFIPIFASWQGGKVTEMVVNHRARTAGVTKYGIGRTWNVILDLILIRFQQRYSQRPIHFFGRVGLYSVLLAFSTFALMLYYKFLHEPLTGYPEKTFIETPLPLLTVMFFLTGVQSVLLGLVAEMVMRTYYESQDKKTYVIGELVQAEILPLNSR
jgi:dolichol-phosphate mannosyltransferase